MAEVCAVFLWMFLSQSECPVVILLFGVRFFDTLHVENGAFSALALLVCHWEEHPTCKN